MASASWAACSTWCVVERKRVSRVARRIDLSQSLIATRGDHVDVRREATLEPLGTGGFAAVAVRRYREPNSR